MTYNPEKLVPLDWNQFPPDYSWKDIVVKIDVILTTKTLSLNLIPEDNEYRHEIITKLHNMGYSNSRFSTYLNEKEIRSPRGRMYYPKLIWVTLNKMKQRNERRHDGQYTISGFRFFVVKRSYW